MLADYIRDLPQAKWGQKPNLHCTNPEPLMSALGQKRTLMHLDPMSALPPKADIAQVEENVRFVPIADLGARASMCAIPPKAAAI